MQNKWIKLVKQKATKKCIRLTEHRAYKPKRCYTKAINSNVHTFTRELEKSFFISCAHLQSKNSFRSPCANAAHEQQRPLSFITQLAAPSRLSTYIVHSFSRIFKLDSGAHNGALYRSSKKKPLRREQTTTNSDARGISTTNSEKVQ